MRSWVRSALAAFIAAFLLTAAPLHALAQASNSLKPATQQELDVTKVLLAQERDWNKGDIDGFAKGYKDSPDTLFVTHQISRGYAGLVDDYKRNYPSREAMGTLSFSEIEVRPLDEKFAVAIGKYHLDRTKKAGGNADGLFTLTFEKTEAGWKIIIDHTT